MEITKLGNTHLHITPLGLGLAALGRPGYINLGHEEDLPENYLVPDMEEHAHRVLDAAYQAGVRYFDAARSYGRAEKFLAGWLASRGISPGDISVGSKWGYTYTAGWKVDAEVHEVKEHSLEVLRRQWKESHEILGPHLDLYQIHSATLESGVLENMEVLRELSQMKEKGLAVGLTVSGENQARVIEKALSCRLDGAQVFETVQATWNLLERSAGPALARAHQQGLGVIVKEALANGRLTARNQRPSFGDKKQRLQQEAEKYSTTIDALALAAALTQPWADVVLSGAARIGHLESNLKASGLIWDENLETALEDLQESSRAYWETRSSLEWN